MWLFIWEKVLTVDMYGDLPNTQSSYGKIRKPQKYFLEELFDTVNDRKEVEKSGIVMKLGGFVSIRSCGNSLFLLIYFTCSSKNSMDELWNRIQAISSVSASDTMSAD
eukprot:gb/GECG01009329.1/.p1 GENE.gb/GECG01009329.1/~~gb/GECG01009329.1/.p1  ORF type:complete len:108 (+),score=11.30 gb/GECG01009329.1/:1-324(+)